MPEALNLHHISVSQMDNNVYLLTSGERALLIDAADNAPAILNLAAEAGVAIEAVVTTHRHWDHHRALAEILETTGAKHYVPYLDAPAIPAKADVELHDGDAIEFAGNRLPVRILRGHTPGGLAVAAEIDGKTNIFVGDSLFPGGLGKTESEGDFVRLFNDVKERIFDVYGDDTVVRPGHGAATTLGAERPNLDEWWARRW